MASPSRFTKLGTSGRSGATGKSDAFQKTYELRVPVVASGAEQTIDITFPNRAVLDIGMLNVFVAEVTGTTKTMNIGTDATNASSIESAISTATVGTQHITGGLVLSNDKITYTLGSADWVEFEGEIVIRVLASDTV